ncbi:MAG: hypothetical protein FWD75_10620 [Propionibacteriaceae bacterium]|nr:hypothetical protein [Propionibacteriaceae bacterium]
MDAPPVSHDGEASGSNHAGAGLAGTTGSALSSYPAQGFDGSGTLPVSRTGKASIHGL